MSRLRAGGVGAVRGAARHLPAPRPEWVFLALYLALSALAVLSLPVGAGFDEATHLARVEQLSDGVLVAPELDRDAVDWQYTSDTGPGFALYGAASDRALVVTALTNAASVHLSHDTYAFPNWVDAFREGAYGERQMVYAFSNTTVNSPVSYVPQVVGFSVARALTSDVVLIADAARAAGVLFLAAVLFFCIRFAPVCRWPLAAIGLLPNTVLVNASVTADTVTLAVCAAFLVGLLRALCAESGRLPGATLGVVAFAGSLLGLVKLTYLPLVFLVLLLPVSRGRDERGRGLVFAVGVIAVCCALFALWYSRIGSINTGAIFKPGVDPDEQKALVLGHPAHFARLLLGLVPTTDFLQLSTFGVLAARGARLAPAWLLAAGLVLSLFATDAREVGSRLSHRVRWLVAGASIAECAVVFVLVGTALYLQFNVVGADAIEGVQGRYFIPLLPMAAVCAWFFASRGVGRLSHREVVPWALVVLFAGQTLLCAIGSARRSLRDRGTGLGCHAFFQKA